jgi:hypothetical protein
MLPPVLVVGFRQDVFSLTRRVKQGTFTAGNFRVNNKIDNLPH